MRQIRNILVGTDFSETSQSAVTYAAHLAARNGARLHIVHVRILVEDLYEEGLPDHARFQQALDRAAETNLHEEPHRIDVEVSRQVLRGASAPAEIVAYANEHSVDLVVVGTRGRSGLAHVLLGSVAQMVVRLSPISVLVVGHEEGGATPRAEFHEILCPIDFSPQSGEAFDAAIALAARHGARVRVLHVVEETTYPPFYRGSAPGWEHDLERIREHTRAEIEKMRAGRGQVPMEVEVVEGRAARAIVDAARTRRVDLLVMGSSGLSGARGYLVGSVAERVLRTAPCPVLIVKGHPDNLEM